MTSTVALIGTTFLMSAAMYVGCGIHEVTTEFYLAHGYSFTRDERQAIQAVADAAARDVRAVLPMLPNGITLKVYAGSGDEVIPETGETGTARAPSTVQWIVDPHRPGGVLRTVREELRASLFHEFYHLARDTRVPLTSDLMDNVVAEGLATAFERDLNGRRPPWSDYPPDVRGWVAELSRVPAGGRLHDWLIRHPDGRRWIGIRAGTYLVDQVTARDGGSPATLVGVSTDGILGRAGRAGGAGGSGGSGESGASGQSGAR